VEQHVTVGFVVDVFLLFLIGIGPKIALVPFLEITADMDSVTKGRVTQKMLATASVVAVLLLLLGELLARLLHFTIGALSIAGGVVLLIIAVTMVLGSGEKRDESLKEKDPMLVADFPLAVPYLLNPVGIVALVTLSGDADTWELFGVVLGALVVVLALDFVIFRSANRISKHLDEGRMLITEKVFGFLLAALAVQLVLDGLSDAGVIHLSGH
jgi:small neutral amino acid transporter SnatA (MarC family)